MVLNSLGLATYYSVKCNCNLMQKGKRVYINDARQLLVLETRTKKKSLAITLPHRYFHLNIFSVASPISGFVDLHEIIKPQKTFINLKSSFIL